MSAGARERESAGASESHPSRALSFSRSLARTLPISLVIGGLLLAIILLIVLLGPDLAPYPYTEMNFADRLAPPGERHRFGADEFGRDVLSRVLYGGRLSLAMGFAATLVALVLGVPLGLIGGYAGGALDEAIGRLLDVLMSFPPILLGLLILAVTPPDVWKTAVAVGLVYAPPLARITRSVTLGLRQEQFVEAARSRGESDAYIVFSEILPNAWPPIIVEASLRVTFAILLSASLSFLGLGAQPPSSDWGLMISEARAFINQAPWIALFPGAAMCLTVIAVNLVGDGLRELLDPRLSRGART